MTESKIQLVMVTGMSGAGKTVAIQSFEDLGYFTIDNMPPALLLKFIELMRHSPDNNKLAVVVDMRSRSFFNEIRTILDELDNQEDLDFKVLFLDATDSELVARYKETRRAHPLAGTDRVEKGIELERKQVKFLKEMADYIIDTSQLLTRELNAAIGDIFLGHQEYDNIYLTILSFGFKYGIPADADLVFDVRFLPNPYYIDELRPKSGNDKEVREYVMDNDKARMFLAKLTDMVEFLIPNYVQEGKTQLVIGIGCTGGKHRSVTLANELYEALSKNDNYGIRIEHRDIGKDAVTKAR